MPLGNKIVFILYKDFIFFLYLKDIYVDRFEYFKTNFSKYFVKHYIRIFEYFFLISDSFY